MDQGELDHGKTEDPSGDVPERTCAVTRAKLAPEDLIRFVRAPDGSIVADLAGRLPGRGVWVSLNRETVAAAARTNPFARSLKKPVTVAADLAERVEHLLVRRAGEALSLANKAGCVVAGFAKVEAAVGSGEAVALIRAADAADDGAGKLERKYRAIRSEIAPNAEAVIASVLTAEQLSLALGRPHVVHAAVLKGGAAAFFLKEAGRLKRYRSHSLSLADTPPCTGSNTEQA